MNREPDDSDEVLELFEQYEKESATLLKLLSDREEAAALLKIAHPAKIADVRAVVSNFDEVIELNEDILDTIAKTIEARRVADGKIAKLAERLDAAKPEILKHFAEHNLENLEEIKALFADDESDDDESIDGKNKSE